MSRFAQIVSREIEKEISHKRAEIKDLEELQQYIATTAEDELEFYICVNSMWANEGEKSIRGTFRGSLKNAVEQAKQAFMRHNKRGDCQADIIVSIKRKFDPLRLGDGLRSIPQKIVQEILDS